MVFCISDRSFQDLLYSYIVATGFFLQPLKTSGISGFQRVEKKTTDMDESIH